MTPEVAWAWHLPAGTRPFTSQSAGCVGGARRDGACAPGTSEPGPGRRSWLNAGASPQGCAFASSRLLRTRRVRSGCMTCCERHRLKGTWRPRSLRPTAVTAGGDVARACGRARGPPGARPLRGRSGSGSAFSCVGVRASLRRSHQHRLPASPAPLASLPSAPRGQPPSTLLAPVWLWPVHPWENAHFQADAPRVPVPSHQFRVSA